ncbi:MAG: 1-(5-phosphoribosyl)-5-[(5-phosphoribosylamino)methylideneamino]imidazole-4-carboxamide isomerase [Microthrixaceae bacterium]|nr:1-(5-phosphoribosyl)-5-[(5-phosphoribosylamino)methylideneamino]imidazole-4-carboxamide isomerase [Microthrixaceae bacterium]MCO5317909.1 1-(5-phosphoribosyl)-5-[(5-phosphoribosylamino)methylideneamino]imidazole-4-carboxamide isomerase [Microthrixaceae bacterium]
MDLFPAVDLLEGRCVRLYQGDYDRVTDYGDDPVAQARAFEEMGARWIHVVDLDAARHGDPVNREVIAAMASAVDIPVQTGGGVRDEESARALFDAGVQRVVMGTAAVEDPELAIRIARDHPVAVGLDARGREVAVRGWREGSGLDLIDLVRRFSDGGIAALVVTEIGRDGTLEGPDTEGLSAVLAATEVPVVASGGVGSLEDLRVLAGLEANGRRLSGAIVGRAIYEGAFSVPDALAACAGPTGGAR